MNDTLDRLRDYADPEEWETWREEMPLQERLTFDGVRSMTHHALRGLVDKATIDLVTEKTIYQLYHRAVRSGRLFALPGVGLVFRVPEPLRRLREWWRRNA